jgi:hypothetical protein
MKRKKIIQIPPRTIPQLVRFSGCSRAAVYNALAYKSHSDMAKEIRKNAIEKFGGVETTKIIF